MNKKIFIIEDDINSCSALTAKFNIFGFKVVSFVDRQILVITNKIKSYQPNLIILDLILSSVDSLELLSALRADEQLVKIPIFIYSEQKTVEEKERAINLGAEQFFDKNKFTLDEFVERAVRIIKNKEKIIN